MTSILVVLHIVSCVFLILVVLLQAGRGADMGAAFGGSSAPMFGSGSAANPLARVTTFTAIAFLTTALFLAVASARRASVFDSVPEPLAAPPQAESSIPSPVDAPPPVAEAQPLTIPATPPADTDPAPDAAAEGAAAVGEAAAKVGAAAEDAASAAGEAAGADTAPVPAEPSADKAPAAP